MTHSKSQSKKLQALFQERDTVKRAWEAAKRSSVRGASRPHYEELKAVEAKIDAIKKG